MGQPFRLNAAKFSSFLGITARELIPVTLDKWSDLTNGFITQIWENIMEKFIFAECYKKYTFGKLRRHWRDHQNLMVKKVMDQAKLVGLKRAATLLKLDSVESMEVWQPFIKKWTNPQQLAINKKYKEMRTKQSLPHRTSRKGFARLEDEMRQESETPDTISRSDVWIRGYEERKKKNGEDEEVEDPEIVVKKYRTQENGSSFRNDIVAKFIRDEIRSGESKRRSLKRWRNILGGQYSTHLVLISKLLLYCFCRKESDFYFCTEKVTFALSLVVR